MASTPANTSQPAITGMNQVPPEIMTVMSLRGIYRAAGNRATFSEESQKTIADIRTELPAAAANGDGLQKINNWRSGGGGGNGGSASSKGHARQGAMTSEGRYSNQQHVARNTSGAFGGRGSERQGHERQGYGPSGGERQGHERHDRQTTSFGSPRFKNSTQQQTVFGTSSGSAAPPAHSHASSVMTVAGVPTTHNGSSPAVPLVSPTQAVEQQQPQQQQQQHQHQQQSSRYVSKFKNSSQAVEKTIVNTLIRGKLNTFSQENYDDINEFLMVILETGDEDPNFLGDFMKLIFTKAAEEDIYCPLYAKLLHDLSVRFPYLIEEMNTLFKRFMGIFEEVSEKSVDNYTDLLERNKEKRYRKGYSQFMAELFKHRIIDHKSFMDTCTLIVHQLRVLIDDVDKLNTVEEYVGCLTKIITGLKGNVPAEIKALVATLSDLTVKGLVKPSFSPKVRFAIMDVINLGS